MRVGVARADAAAHHELDADGRVRLAVALDRLHQPPHAPLGGGHGELVVGQVGALLEQQVPREGVRLVEHPVGAPPEGELLGRLDAPHLLALEGDRLERRRLREDLRDVGVLGGRELPVRRDALAVEAALAQALERPLEEIDRRALLDPALVGKPAVGVHVVEIRLGLGRPPRADEVAVEARIEPDRGEAVGRQVDGERALGRREEKSREVDDVPAVSQQEARKAALGEPLGKLLEPRLVPREGKPVIGRRLQAVVLRQEECGGAWRGARRGRSPSGSGGDRPDRGGARCREEAAAVPGHDAPPKFRRILSAGFSGLWCRSHGVSVEDLPVEPAAPAPGRGGASCRLWDRASSPERRTTTLPVSRPTRSRGRNSGLRSSGRRF